MKTLIMTILYQVTFSYDDTGRAMDSMTAYFENQEDAQRVANLPLGYFNGGGSAYEKLFKPNEALPTYYKSVKEYADDRLTHNQIIKFGLL